MYKLISCSVFFKYRETLMYVVVAAQLNVEIHPQDVFRFTECLMHLVKKLKRLTY
jgi:hypothetical protein